MTYLSPRKTALLQLPTVISEKAWLEAVFIKNFLYTELSNRLQAVIHRAHQELLKYRDFEEENYTGCGLYLFPADGERTDRVWVDLSLVIERHEGEPKLLRVILTNEIPDT